MRAFLLVVFCAAATPGALQAQTRNPSNDPLHSPECDAARAVLERALGDASARKPGANEALAKARQAAMGACLGREDAGRERSGAPYPSIAVRPPVIEAARVAPVVPVAPVMPVVPMVPVSPAPPFDAPRPAAITTCDPGGCWDSEGRRLNSVGPLLVGPRGPCTAQSGVVHCP